MEKHKYNREQILKDDAVTRRLLDSVAEKMTPSRAEAIFCVFGIMAPAEMNGGDARESLAVLDDIKSIMDEFSKCGSFEASMMEITLKRLVSIKSVLVQEDGERLNKMQEEMQAEWKEELRGSEKLRLFYEDTELFNKRILSISVEHIHIRYGKEMKGLSKFSQRRLLEKIKNTRFLKDGTHKAGTKLVRDNNDDDLNVKFLLGVDIFEDDVLIDLIVDPWSTNRKLEEMLSPLDMKVFRIMWSYGGDMSKYSRRQQKEAEKVIRDMILDRGEDEFFWIENDLYDALKKHFEFLQEKLAETQEKIKEVEKKMAEKAFEDHLNRLNDVKDEISNLLVGQNLSINDLPKVERFWRSWRDENGHKLETYQKDFNRAKKSNEYPFQWPPQSMLSSFFATRVIQLHEKREQGYTESNTFSFFANYKQTKSLWKLDKDLVEELCDLPWPGQTPSTALLHLPCDSAVFWTNKDVEVVWWFDSVPYDEHDNISKVQTLKNDDGKEVGTPYMVAKKLHPAIHIAMIDYEAKSIPTRFLLPLKEGLSLDQAFKASADTFAPGRNVNQANTTFVQNIVNILLYAAGEEDIVQKIGHKFPLSNKSVRRAPRQETVKRDYSNPSLFDVGIRFGSAIRRYKDSVRRQYEAGTSGRRQPPHIRRAHPHLYWVGPRRETPIVKFLPPIPVNMSDLPSEMNRVTAQRVS